MRLRLGVAVIGLLLFASEARADRLIYYVYPSPLGIVWKTPRKLAWSTLWNSVLDDNRFHSLHTLGHVNFDLRCDSGVRVVTGQTNSDDEQMEDLLLKQHYGLGMLFSDYAGRWESREEIERDLPIRLQTGMISFIRFEISPQTCARVAAYLQEYQALGYDKIYGGLEHLPRRREGGGCSAFGESVLEIAGLMAPEWRVNWRNSVNVPKAVVGGPMTGNDVSLFGLLFGSASAHWSKTAENAIALTFWDPKKALDWIRAAFKYPMPLTGMSYAPARWKNARGIKIDARNVPTPTESFWLF